MCAHAYSNKKICLEAKLTKEMKGKSVTRDARGRSTCPGPNHGWGWAEAGHVAPLVATVRPRGDPVEPTQAHASTRRPMVEPRKWPRPRSRNRGPHGSRAHHAPPPTPPPPTNHHRRRFRRRGAPRSSHVSGPHPVGPIASLY